MLESKRFSIWRRLGQRFLLEDQPPTGQGAQVFTQILPTTDADTLLRQPTWVRNSVDLTGSGSAFVATHTVPAGERWTILAYTRQSTSAATEVDIRPEGQSLSMQIGVYGTSSELVHDLNLVMNPGDAIGLVETGDAGDGSKYIFLYYLSEDAY